MLANIMGVTIHDIPKEFFCPIYMKVMTDPVTTTVGNTYERRAIESWFRRGFNSDPVTGANLVSNKLVPNVALREAINSYNPAFHSNYQKASVSINALNNPPPFTKTSDVLNDKSSNVLDLVTMLHTIMCEKETAKIDPKSNVLNGIDSDNGLTASILFAVKSLCMVTNKSVANRDEVRKYSGISPLVALLSLKVSNDAISNGQVADNNGFMHVNDIECKTYAARTLSILSYNNPANQEEIRACGGLPRLVAWVSKRRIGKDEVEMLRHVTAAIAHMSISPSVQTTMLEIDGIRPIARLLSLTDSITNDTETRRFATKAIGNLINGNVSSQEMVKEVNAVPLIIALIRKCHDIETIRWAAMVLCVMTSSASCRSPQKETEAASAAFHHTAPLKPKLGDIVLDFLRKIGAVEPLIQLLSVVPHRLSSTLPAPSMLSPMSPLHRVGKPDMLTIRFASKAISNLASNECNQDLIREAKGIVALVKLLPTVQASVAAAVGTGSDANAIVNVSQAIDTPTNDIETYTNVALALANLAFNKKNQDAIREANAVPSLVYLLGSCTAHIEVIRYTAKAILNLTNDHLVNKYAFCEANAISHLVSILEHTKDAETERYTSMALINLKSNSLSTYKELVLKLPNEQKPRVRRHHNY